MSEDRIQSFEEFWPFYVGEHRLPSCRAMHYLGSGLLTPALALKMIKDRNWKLLALLPVVGYGCSWFGHFILEKNRPATFTYPLWSLRGDYKMVALALQGKMADEVTRLYGSPHPAPDAPLLSDR